MSEKLARQFHEIYERLAPSFGYETRTETRAFDPYTPNGRLMIAVCSEIDREHQAQLRGFMDAALKNGEDIVRLEALLAKACTYLREVGDDYPGSSCQQWCHEKARECEGTTDSAAPSRSQQRRIALQKGEPVPEFPARNK